MTNDPIDLFRRGDGRLYCDICIKKRIPRAEEDGSFGCLREVPAIAIASGRMDVRRPAPFAPRGEWDYTSPSTNPVLGGYMCCA